MHLHNYNNNKHTIKDYLKTYIANQNSGAYEDKKKEDRHIFGLRPLGTDV